MADDANDSESEYHAAVERDMLRHQFVAFTKTNEETADAYLEACDWHLQTATNLFFSGAPAVEEPEPGIAPEGYTGPRTLDGRPAPRSALAPSSGPPAKKKGLATLGSLASSRAGRANHEDSDLDDDDDGDKPNRETFAGGEKSGLAIQDEADGDGSNRAKKIMKEIFSHAKDRGDLRSSKKAAAAAAAAGPSDRSFRGTGFTLGGDGVESRTIPDPRGDPIPRLAQDNESPERRMFHVWTDGFSFDEGPLYRYDDPTNARSLDMIRRGQIPTYLLGIQFGQEVEVQLVRHSSEWRQLPRTYRPFSSHGHRLGSPMPGAGAAAAAAAEAAAAVPTSTVDESQPTVTIRLGLPDGRRVPVRFNTTQTVGDLYRAAAQAFDADGRMWLLATTFPAKEQNDKSLVLGDMPEFNRGGTVIVKWA